MTLPEPKAPPADDMEANVRWLRDSELIKALAQRYAYGIDTMDFEVVRSVFHSDCKVQGTLEEGPLEPYLEGIEEGLKQWEATFHFMGNQYVRIEGDTGHLETWAVAYHMEAEGSPIADLVLALRYQDDVVRVGRGARAGSSGPPGLVARGRGRRPPLQRKVPSRQRVLR